MATSDFDSSPIQNPLRCELIGTIKKIIVYPLDGGPPQYLTKARCSKDGLKTLTSLLDRFMVAYNPTTKDAILNVHNPLLSTRDITSLIRAFSDHYSPSQEIEINYFGNPLTVEDAGDRIAREAQKIFDSTPEKMRIAYCSAKNRQQFGIDLNLLSKDVSGVDILSSYFANYTLVYCNSLKLLEGATKKHTDEFRFRANLVIQGCEEHEGCELAFCENEIICLIIGSNIFSNILPCTHTPFAFTDRPNILNPKELEPYGFLKRFRTVQMGRKSAPVFGINMSLASGGENEIKEGDVVKAYYFPDNWEKFKTTRLT